VIGSVLDPLAERHRRWLQMSADEVAADRQEIVEDDRAMPLILRMERDDPPVWSAALVASCRAATALCLDERAEPGGQWHPALADYLAGHIRKVTRRARAGHWTAVDDLPGITVRAESTEVRALLPGPVADLDKRVSRLQVGGTDVPIDLTAGELGEPPAGALLLAIPAGVPMTTGKLMAQTGHAGMIAAALLAASEPGTLNRWRDAGLPVEVRLVALHSWQRLLKRAGTGDGWDERLVAVRDAGFTEIDPGTITVIADAAAL
jgi:peptidyl-tRNA hydrolase